MTKRLKSKHKVDRRLKANLWGRPKSPFNVRAYPPGQHGQNKGSLQIWNCFAKQKPKIMEISMKDVSKYDRKLYQKEETPQKI